jgi:tRNA(fMet)-specific endonuclease VapC
VGLILDSSILIASERKGLNARQTLATIAAQAPGEDVALSAITVMELAHGASRAETAERKATRLGFLTELISALPVHSVTTAIALRAGQIDAECSVRGVRIALSDLLIGVTALTLRYRVATSNLRHFRMIPGLEVTPL